MNNSDRAAVAQLAESGGLDEILEGMREQYFKDWMAAPSPELHAKASALTELRREFIKIANGNM